MEFLPRNCIDDAKKDAGPRPLSEFRSRSAYVLLGEPGAGKTRCFEEEAIAQEGSYIKAREFFYGAPKSEWKGKTLFIDGLDEMRAGAGSGRLPLDMISNQLESLGRPQFRLSCREGDWLGSLDRGALQALAPAHDLTVLRLVPLTEKDIKTLLVKQLGSAEAARNFVAQAEATGLSELLANPKNLEILLTATSNGKERLRTRQEAFELACRKLAIDHSEIHQVINPPPAEEKLLNASGLISTLLLLTDKSGLALRPATANDFYPALTEIEPPRELPLEAALKSKLFIADGDGRRAASHRSVAEYLAARYLANEIKRKSFPWRRLLSILSGQDGKPVAGLRGLWAWLASLVDGDARRELINADPVAVILYGDVHPLPQSDKKYLLQSLHRATQSYPWLLSGQWSLSPFGALAAPDMVENFREILTAPARDDAQQVLVDLVLEAICHSNPLPSLANTLEVVVRDATRWPAIQRAALQAWRHVTPPNNENSSRFLSLLEDIHSNAVEDSDDELLGILLDQLYTTHLQPKQILDYLHVPKRTYRSGSYWKFLRDKLLERTPNENLPEILDQLASNELLRDQLAAHKGLRNIFAKFLVHGLIGQGEHISPNRLYDWLGIGLDKYRFMRIGDESKTIADWFSTRPERYKAVIADGIKRLAQKDNIPLHFVYKLYQRFYGATPPADLGLWLLQQAAEVKNEQIAKGLFQEAMRTAWSNYGNEGISLEKLETWVVAHPRFRSWFEEMLYSPLPEDHLDYVREGQEWEKQAATNKREWLRFFRGHQTSLCEGKAPPKVLDDLAGAYFGLSVNAHGDTPHDRLSHFLDGDKDLIDAALTGLRNAPFRDDLPSVEKIVRISIQGHRHLMSYPCLAGMEEAPENLFELDDVAIEKLLAMHFTLDSDKNPEWFAILKVGMPELVSKALVAYASPTLRSKKATVVFGLYGLAHDQEYETVAPLATPLLLSAFPLLARKEQLNDLEYLLKSALRYLKEDELLTRIEQRLTSKSLDNPQRTLWLTAGFIAFPERFRVQLQSHVGISQTRAEQVAGFLPTHGENWPFHKRPDALTLAWLIEVLGPRCAPYKLEGAGWISPAMNMADLVRSVIAQLGGIPTGEAASALTALASRPALSAWRDALRAAVHEQTTLMREDQFRHPEIADLLRTLKNEGPATVADLAALTQENLEILASRIHDGGNNEYEKFWSYDDSNKMLNQPKPENACRNMLLTDLQALLPQHVIAQRETYFVEDKRADIVVSYNAFQVPIEIKKDNYRDKNNRRDLWNSIRNQLIAQYTREPKTEGYGIYVVLWFGGKDMPPPPSGPKPRNPEELASRLRELLSLEEQRRIGVVVIDCSLPSARA
ncbi:MAG TPA: hypothetical protein VM532_12840 [Burkholderiales bacterium]|nr:hypothetical protein [Burkholderiales bacterium]